MPSKTERLAADPVNCVDLWGLTASDIVAGEAVLQGAAKRADRLQDLINTDNLAQIMSSNIDSFDSATKEYYAAMPESVRTAAIREQLNKTIVYSGIDEAIEQQVFDNFGATANVSDVNAGERFPKFAGFRYPLLDKKYINPREFHPIPTPV